MRLLMLGWEFPPYISGGLGTACHGLVRAMERSGMDILLVLPMAIKGPPGVCETSRLSRTQDRAKHLTLRSVPSVALNPYPVSGRPSAESCPRPIPEVAPKGVTHRPSRPSLRLLGAGAVGGYDGDLTTRIWDYADRCTRLAEHEAFDVIHAHDWMTFPAGMSLAARSGRPLVVQVHATEFDRSGEHVNPALYEVERRGMEAAAIVITVSHLTKRRIVEGYGIPPEKVRVIHNGIEAGTGEVSSGRHNGKEKTVLFLGRITMQKGPEFFVRAAARVLQCSDRVRFIMAGWGDLAPQIIEQVAALGLGDRIRFTGFLRGAEVDRAYRMADVYVLPSVSEPFGLTALEAIRCGVPVILSKTSGVAEVLPTGALTCDFWDTQGMADKILAVLNRPELADHLRRRAREEIGPVTWEAAAQKCMEVYQEAIARHPLSAWS